ncbi:MAG TPA: glycosyltransferase [Pyrinomonadaceae bacterium]|jgi:glycosyltransferase involved in cell wall biosynthesis
MKLSVHIITFNHAPYIAQAVESALNQETNFDYEIVVGEDCSTDGTREILIDLQKRHPDKIRLLLREHNLGAYGKNNFIDTLYKCTGEYVALLDGDDYWTSPHKLQKQVDFLDSHPDCSVCFHNALVVSEVAPQNSSLFNDADQKEISTLADIVRRNFICACTVMFRRNLFGRFPPLFYKVLNGDWMLSVLNAQHGDIGYINEVMATYRIHEGAVWTRLGGVEQYASLLKTYDAIDRQTRHQYTHVMRDNVLLLKKLQREAAGHGARISLDEYRKATRSGDVKNALPFLWKALKLAPLEVLTPRRVASLLKNSLLGLVGGKRET